MASSRHSRRLRTLRYPSPHGCKYCATRGTLLGLGDGRRVQTTAMMDFVRSVQTVVEDQFARWAGTGIGAIERDVLGTDDPRQIAETFESFCIRNLVHPLRALCSMRPRLGVCSGFISNLATTSSSRHIRVVGVNHCSPPSRR